MKLQSRGSPENARFRDSHAGVPGVPGQNGHLDATPAASRRVYYKEYGGDILPSPGRGVSCGPKCPWLVPTPKGVPECELTTLWFVLNADSSLIY